MKPEDKRAIIISVILIIILGFAVYGNSLNGKFIWDDEGLVEDNTYIKNYSYISKLFTENIGAGLGEGYSFCRPLQMITYMINYSLFKLDVRGYHLTNILLHILTALSIYWLINILYEDRLLSLFTSILFVVHPIHTEAVAYISGRADSLVTLFMLTCFILYIKHLHSNNKSTYILMLLCYILALLSRENSLILPVLLLLYHYTLKKKFKIKEYLPVLSIAIVYILLRTTVLKSLLPYISYNTNLFQRIPGFFVAITNYIRLLFLPFNLHMEYGYKLFNFTDPKAISGIVIVFLLLIYAFKRRNTNNLIFFSILWFFITLLPQSNLYAVNAYMAEHWLYIPSIGFFLIVGNALNSLYRRKESRILTICLIAGLVSFYSYLTIRQNSYWREPITFYKRTLRYAPDNPTIYYNLGNIYRDGGKKEEAIALYKKAIAINPNYAEAYNSIGSIYHNIGKKEEAIILFKKAIEINPNLAKSYNNLAITYYTIGKKEEVVTLFKKAIEINPNLAEAYYNLGFAYKNTGNREGAIALFKKAIAINPNYAAAHNNLALIYKNIGKNEEAIVSYKKAIKLNPNTIDTYNNLGVIYMDIGNNEKAIPLFKKAIEINPNYATAHFNLSTIYYNKKQYDLAIKHCDRAIELGYKVSPKLLELLKPYRK